MPRTRVPPGEFIGPPRQTSFGVDMRAAVEGIKGDVAAVITQAVQTVSQRIILATPVDTGFARNSWFTSIDHTPATHPSPPSKGETGKRGSSLGSPGENPAHMVGAMGHVWGLSNGSAYIVRLEYGHSKRAPTGMVRVTLSQWESIVAEAVRQVGP